MSKLVYPGGFVRIRPMLNKTFVPSREGCRVCCRLSCATSYFHLERRELVCVPCMGDAFENGRDMSERLSANEDCPNGVTFARWGAYDRR